MEVGHGVRTGGGVSREPSSPVVQLSRREGTPPKDEMFLMLVVLTLLQIQFPFLVFTPAISLLLSLGHRFSSFLFLTRHSSVLHSLQVACCLDLLKHESGPMAIQGRTPRPHMPQVLIGKMENRHQLVVLFTFLLLSVPFEIPFNNLNAQSRSSLPFTSVCTLRFCHSRPDNFLFHTQSL